MTSLKTLTLQKEKLQQQIASEEEAISSLKEKLKDLDTADQNVDAILQMQIPEPVKSKPKISNDNYHKTKEELSHDTRRI